jgi:hypothetical protein
VRLEEERGEEERRDVRAVHAAPASELKNRK